MKTILKILMKNNRWAIMLIILLIIVGGSIYQIQHKKILNLKDKYDSEVKLKNALIDTVEIFKNKEGEWVAEKLTIQAELNYLDEMNTQLTESQKNLIKKIKEVNKENSVITAALIHANFVIDSLKHSGVVLIDTTNKTVNFIETDNPNINYNFLATGVLPFPINTKPNLFINKLTLPNEQFIEFHWEDNKRKGYPISFSVTNSNKYVKVYDVNGYAIPALKKEIIDPTGWQKIGLWFNKNGKIVGYVFGGVVVGAGGTYFLMK
jgi:hypothetical protein